MQLRPAPTSNATNSRSYPTFHPHVTLAAFDAEPAGLQPALETLAGEAEPVVSYFSKLVAGDSYLGAMKVQLEKTPGLVQLHARVTDILRARDIAWRSRGFPHLSLFYVDGAEERQRLAAHIGGADVVLRKRESSRIMLRAGPRGRPLRRLIGAGIWLVDCRGAVEKWQVLAKLQLANESDATIALFLSPLTTTTLMSLSSPGQALTLRKRPLLLQKSPRSWCGSLPQQSPQDLSNRSTPLLLPRQSLTFTGVLWSFLPLHSL
ncbi:hypothetical protein AURDEDRAFT_132289 [Auricularia subglabra TFB-10046 SS5]|nr:hypothetical protein AURDEDRAFT_132289 [Auricularia subglabra TFB-10046 SS5]